MNDFYEFLDKKRTLLNSQIISIIENDYPLVMQVLIDKRLDIYRANTKKKKRNC